MDLLQLEGAVLPEWIDANGHMNLAYYVVLFDQATDLLYDALGVGQAYRFKNHIRDNPIGRRHRIDIKRDQIIMTTVINQISEMIFNNVAFVNS